MQLRIRNVLGLEDVRLPLPAAGLTLVAGLNGAGKSSLLECIAAAALGDWKMRGVALKRDAAELVRNGADQGSILLEHPAGSVRITYPDGKVERQGKTVEYGTPLGIGALKWMDLSPEQRARELSDRFGMAPSRDDFDGWWRTHPAAGLSPDALDGSMAHEAIKLLWQDIEVSGWDAIAKRVEGEIKMLQGQWREVTGVNWGDRLRQTWAPDGLYRDEEYSHADAQHAVGAATDALADLLRQKAASATERQAAADAAAPLADLEKQRDAQAATLAEIDVETERVVGELEAVGEPIDPRTFPSCPHCFASIRVVRSPSAGVALEKPTKKAMSVDEYQKQLALRAALNGTLAQLKERRAAADRQQVQLAERIRVAMEAKAKHEGMAVLPDADHGAITAARRALDEAEKRLKSIRTLARAKEINAEWEHGCAILDGLLPTGIRAGVFERKMSALNEQLASFSGAAGMHAVGIALDCTLTYDGRRYPRLSESEKWRADLVMALLLAEREGSRLLLVDRLDLLHPQAREGVARLLAGTKRSVIATMTARAWDPRYVPDLDSHKLGHACWLGGGKLVEER